ncbi:hypothetical protein DIPPA_31813 [Diplonema papillatum]|nr:hypothetical protein DIPPA_31813 [Diplonema papillatum]
MRASLPRLAFAKWVRGVPWRYDPVPADNTYWPSDRLARLYVNTARLLQHAVGFLLHRKLTPLSESDIVDASEVIAHEVSPGHSPLIMLQPRGLHTPASFTISTDQLIGGHTEAFVDATEDDTLLFHGTLRVTRDPVRMSLAVGRDVVSEEHVGYAFFELYISFWFRYFCVGVRGIEIRCRGSSHPYILRYQTRALLEHEHLMHMFVPTDDFRCYVLRFDHMRFLSRGAEQPMHNVIWSVHNADKPPKSIAIGINCGEEDDFWLEIDYVRFVTLSAQEILKGNKKWKTAVVHEHDKYG